VSIRDRFRTKGHVQGRYVLLSSIVVALIVTPFAFASGEGEGDNARLGTRNPKGAGALTTETQIIAQSKTYGTRQSNKSIGDGGAAIYGCRSAAVPVGQSGGGIEPCLRGNNLSTGRAFEFNTQNGAEVGRITVGDGKGTNSAAKPFTTNATGVATGLNADQVDSKSADDIVKDARSGLQGEVRFAAVSGPGVLATGSRGAATATRTSNGNYDVAFTDDVAKCAYTATAQAIDAGSVAVVAKDAKTISVRTRDGGGTVADEPFHLVVTC
jgi:hypothetical protein